MVNILKKTLVVTISGGSVGVQQVVRGVKASLAFMSGDGIDGGEGAANHSVLKRAHHHGHISLRETNTQKTQVTPGGCLDALWYS